MISALVTLISGVSGSYRRDDNVVDRFNNRYTVILLVLFAVVSTTYQLVGDPITCWSPTEFDKRSGWIKYTNTLCWVKNTYFLPFEEQIPKEYEKRDEIFYYQWVPFIFLGMAVLFYLPSVVWTSLNSKAGVDSDNILESADTFRKTDKLESKEKLLKLITNQLDRFVGRTPKMLAGMIVDTHSPVTKRFCRLCGNKFGNYLVILYLCTKILYIVNALSQLFILNSVLRTDFSLFGIEALVYASQEKEFLNHTIFPKVTMCDVRIRALGVDNTRTYTVQCLLPINLYTEKMFVFLWFWITIILILTIIDLIGWILKSALSKDRYSFIVNNLLMSSRVEKHNLNDQRLCWKFVQDYLRLDGVFVLRLVAHNTNKITSSEIIASLWDKWREKEDEPMCEPLIAETALDADYSEQADTLPMKPLIADKPPKPPKPLNYRPHEAPPQPPPNLSYPSLRHVGGSNGQMTSPPPSAPPNEFWKS